MFVPNRLLINIFRGLFVLLLALNIFHGAISENPRFSSVSSWGDFWYGLFLTATISWLILEGLNWYFRKTKIGHLPSYFWAVAVGLNGADFFNSYSKLFEVSHFDKLAHAAGGFFFGILILSLVKRFNVNYGLNLNKTLIYYLTITSVNLGGIIYEIGEWVGDKYFGSNNITGIFDTTGDLIFNNIGLFLVLIIDWVYHRIEKSRRI